MTGPVRAVAATSWSGLNGIRVIDAPHRDPGGGELVVAVRAAGISPFDYKRAQGMVAPGEGLPLRLGHEAAGVVIAAGPGGESDAFRQGDEVFGQWLPGAQASELTVPAAALLPKPPTLSFAEAAGLLGSGTAAWHALDAARVEAGDVVIVHGAAGAVGNMVAQLALLRGARVIGTAAPDRHDALRAQGIDPAAYRPGLLNQLRSALRGETATAAIEAAGTDEAIAASAKLIHDPSRIVTLANFRAAHAIGAQALGPGPDTIRIRTHARTEVARLAAEGQLTVRIAGEFPLEDARRAYAVLATGHAGGKLLVTP